MFEFDPEKSAANLAKHGIDFETAQKLWDAERFAEGPTVSPDEERWMRVAMLEEKLWSAIFTYRDDRIRLISVRRSRPKEVLQYERQDDQG
ncbi:MAG: BrnT family toxin [Novosphingobium sp.]